MKYPTLSGCIFNNPNLSVAYQGRGFCRTILGRILFCICKKSSLGCLHIRDDSHRSHLHIHWCLYWVQTMSMVKKRFVNVCFGCSTDMQIYISGAPRAKRACGAPWVNKSTHPILARLGAQEKADCTSMLSSIDSCQNRVSADQYCPTVSRAQVSTHQGRVFFWSYPLTIYSFSNDRRLTFTFFKIHIKYVVFMSVSSRTIKILISNWPQTQKFSQFF